MCKKQLGLFSLSLLVSFLSGAFCAIYLLRNLKVYRKKCGHFKWPHFFITTYLAEAIDP